MFPLDKCFTNFVSLLTRNILWWPLVPQGSSAGRGVPKSLVCGFQNASLSLSCYGEVALTFLWSITGIQTFFGCSNAWTWIWTLTQMFLESSGLEHGLETSQELHKAYYFTGPHLCRGCKGDAYSSAKQWKIFPKCLKAQIFALSFTLLQFSVLDAHFCKL